MTSTPLFSVIIPTCNRNQLLAQCLQLLQPGAQTLDASLYEVIVSDDSPNNEAEALIKSQFAWATYTPGPKRGPAANRNNGARLAGGEWLVFTDDDCLPDANWLQAYADAILQHPECKAFEGAVLAERERITALEDAPINQNGGNFWSSNICMAKKKFDEVDGFDEQFLYPHLEDIDLRNRIESAMSNPIKFVIKSIVIHPWRRVKPGRLLAEYHEAEFYYFQEKKGIAINRFPLSRNIIAARIMPLKHNFKLKEAGVIFYNLTVELFHTMKNFSTWNRRHPVKNTAG